MCKEYQFRVGNVILDVHAKSSKEAAELLNSQLPLLDDPLPAPGLIQRVVVDVPAVSEDDIVEIITGDNICQ